MTMKSLFSNWTALRNRLTVLAERLRRAWCFESIEPAVDRLGRLELTWQSVVILELWRPLRGPHGLSRLSHNFNGDLLWLTTFKESITAVLGSCHDSLLQAIAAALAAALGRSLRLWLVAKLDKAATALIYSPL